MTALSTLLERAKALKAKSTNVVAWYAHPSWTHKTGEVRGPFGRWFACTGGDNGMDQTECPTPVAPISDDIEYCAFAMNALPQLVALVEEMAGALEELDCDCSVRERLSGHCSECRLLPVKAAFARCEEIVRES